MRQGQSRNGGAGKYPPVTRQLWGRNWTYAHNGSSPAINRWKRAVPARR
ncbi:hypothetical protein ACNKHQ_01615 [Shigella flexneri]